MGERRRQVLDAIQWAAEPVGVSEIADRIGVHPPFLELAEPHRYLVCPCTWDWCRALTELRAPVTVTALTPFVETTPAWHTDEGRCRSMSHYDKSCYDTFAR
jgi:hypothetical protein